MDLDVKIKLSRGAGRPNYATPGSAGFDLTARIEQPLTIKPGELVSVPTGVAIQIQSPGYAAFCFARSGLGIKHGITLSNGVGVIDNDYTGEIRVGLVNLSNTPYTLNVGDRIAQVVIIPYAKANFIDSSNFDITERGDGGFGSSGK